MRPAIPVMKRPELLPEYIERSFYKLYFDEVQRRYIYSYIDDSLSTDQYYKVVSQIYRDPFKRQLDHLEYNEVLIDLPYGYTGYVRLANMFFPTNKPCPDYPVYLPWYKYQWWMHQSGEPGEEDEIQDSSDHPQRVVYPPKHVVTESGCSCMLKWRIEPAPDPLVAVSEDGQPRPGPRGNQPHFSELARSYNRYKDRYPPNSPLMRSLRISLDRLHIDPDLYDRDGWAKGLAHDSEVKDQTREELLQNRLRGNAASQIRFDPNSGSGQHSAPPNNGYSGYSGSSTPSSYAGGESYGGGYGGNDQGYGFSSSGYGADGGRAPDNDSSSHGATYNSGTPWSGHY